jgi:hypothetical protein
MIVMLSIPETIVSDNALFLVISDLSTISLVKKINDWCLFYLINLITSSNFTPNLS